MAAAQRVQKMTISKVVQIKNEIYNIHKNINELSKFHRDNLENCDYFFDLIFIISSMGENVFDIYTPDGELPLARFFGDTFDGISIGSYKNNICLKRGNTPIFTSSCKFEVQAEEKATIDLFKKTIDVAVVTVKQIGDGH
jgi:hypothetical protein